MGGPGQLRGQGWGWVRWGKWSRAGKAGSLVLSQHMVVCWLVSLGAGAAQEVQGVSQEGPTHSGGQAQAGAGG